MKKAMTSRLIWRFATGYMAILLMACAGSSGDQFVGIDRGGVRDRVVIGVVTGFGSIFVNGVRYSTDVAEIEIDGQPGTDTDLRLGQVVTIDAELAGTTTGALSVHYESNAIGPAAAIDMASGMLTVLGQEVVVTTETWWGGSLVIDELAGVAAGDLLRVSGLRDASDRIIATRIEPVSAGSTFKLLGIARDVDVVARTLYIGGQLVDYSAAGLVSGFPAGGPRSGDLLRISAGNLGASGELLADTLEWVPILPATESGEQAEIDGIITAVLSSSEFEIGALRVLTSADTEFEHGSAASLAVDARVEVEGEFDATGRLLAGKIEFEDRSVLRIEGTVTAKVGSRFTVLGVDIEANGLTKLDSIQPGDCAKVGGFESIDEPGVVIASRLEREDSCGKDKLRGIVATAAEPQLLILGLTVLTDGGTSLPGGSAADFFSSAPGRLVEVQGDFDGTVLLATEVEFKD